MKFSHIITLSLITILIIALAPWFFIFSSSPISHSTGNWSDFGSYIGGITGPILSFISIILVLKTIKQTQDNHSEQIELIRHEQTYIKFSDLSEYLLVTISKCWLGKDDEVNRVMFDIHSRIVTHRLFEDGISPETKSRIEIEAIYDKVQEVHSRNIDEVVMIIRSLNKLIFNSTNYDKELMSSMIESRLTKRQRFLINYLMNYTHKNDAKALSKNWPTFWDSKDNSDAIHHS